MRGRSTSCLTRQCNRLTRSYPCTLFDKILRVMRIVRLQPVGVLDPHQIAITGKDVGEDDLAIERSKDFILVLRWRQAGGNTTYQYLLLLSDSCDESNQTTAAGDTEMVIVVSSTATVIFIRRAGRADPQAST